LSIWPSAACSHRLGAIILRGLVRQGALASSLFSLTHQPLRLSFELWAMATALRWGLWHRLALAFGVGLGLGSFLPRGDKLAVGSRILACRLQAWALAAQKQCLEGSFKAENRNSKKRNRKGRINALQRTRLRLAAEGRAIRLTNPICESLVFTSHL